MLINQNHDYRKYWLKEGKYQLLPCLLTEKWSIHYRTLKTSAVNASVHHTETLKGKSTSRMFLSKTGRFHDFHDFLLGWRKCWPLGSLSQFWSCFVLSCSVTVFTWLNPCQLVGMMWRHTAYAVSANMKRGVQGPSRWGSKQFLFCSLYLVSWMSCKLTDFLAFNALQF